MPREKALDRCAERVAVLGKFKVMMALTLEKQQLRFGAPGAHRLHESPSLPIRNAGVSGAVDDQERS